MCVRMLGWVFVKGLVVKRMCVVFHIVVMLCFGVAYVREKVGLCVCVLWGRGGG